MHTRLLALYLSNPASDLASWHLVFHQMWQQNPDGLLAVLLEFYGEDENNMERVWEIGLELQVYFTA